VVVVTPRFFGCTELNLKVIICIVSHASLLSVCACTTSNTA